MKILPCEGKSKEITAVRRIFKAKKFGKSDTKQYRSPKKDAKTGIIIKKSII